MNVKKSNTMQTIKIHKQSIDLNGKKYRGYAVGELPERFAFLYNDNKDQDGIYEWFNYNGLTFIPNSQL